MKQLPSRSTAPGRMQSTASLPTPLDKGVDYGQYTTYRLLYHLDRFIHGWRNLLVFYLAMFIAGFAQVINSWVFWSSWASLVVVYWEPYLSPPYAWTEGADKPPVEDSFTNVTLNAWDDRPQMVKLVMSYLLRLPAFIERWWPATEDEKQGMRQWLHAVRKGLWETQQLVHRCLCGLIAVPCICLFIGAITQAPPDDSKAVYSGYLLLALVCVYTVLTSTSLIVFISVVRPTLAIGSHLEPKDMMFFTCKILGQILDTTVQTLVAGSFTAYMPSGLFWLCIAITAMSYTATNLLYDLDPEQTVKDHSTLGSLLGRCAPRCGGCCKGSKDCDGGQLNHDGSCTPHSPAAGVMKSLQYRSTEVGKNDCNVPLDQEQAGRPTPSAEHTAKDVILTVQTPAVAHNKQLSDYQDVSPSPPFLLYKYPKGVRGWSIILLLMAVSGPSAVVFYYVVKGMCTGDPSYYFVDEDGTCGKLCFMRYQQMLFMLCISAFLTCYYALTVGFVGAGPVTCLYKRVYKR